jgi:hypothetical protein
MFIANEALFFRGGDDFTVNNQCGGRIMIESAGQTENYH